MALNGDVRQALENLGPDLREEVMNTTHIRPLLDTEHGREFLRRLVKSMTEKEIDVEIKMRALDSLESVHFSEEDYKWFNDKIFRFVVPIISTSQPFCKCF